MAKFVKAPGAGEEGAGAEAGPLDTATAWLAGQGVETGPAGLAVTAFGGALLVFGLVRLGLVVWRHGIAAQTEGEVVDVQPAEGGGFAPVVRFVDPAGKARRFVAEMATTSDPTGRRVLVRVIGGRPRVVAPGPDLLTSVLGAVLPLAIGGAAVVTGLTGALLGMVALPWP